MNENTRFTKLVTLHDPAQAEVLRGMLEAQGMHVLLTKEAAAQVYGTFVGSLGEIELYVAAEDEDAASKLLDEFLVQ